MDISQLLKVPPQQPSDRSQEEFGQEQSKDSELKRMMQFLKIGSLPDYISQSKKISAQALQFSLIGGILYYVSGLRRKILQEIHGGILAGHFSANHLFSTLSGHWWWDTMCRD